VFCQRPRRPEEEREGNKCKSKRRLRRKTINGKKLITGAPKENPAMDTERLNYKGRDRL